MGKGLCHGNGNNVAFELSELKDNHVINFKINEIVLIISFDQVQ